MLDYPCPVVLHNYWYEVLVSGQTPESPSKDALILSNVFLVRPLGSFQAIHSPAALQLHLRTRGRILEIFVLETCEPKWSGADMIPPPLCFSSGKCFEFRIKACHIGRW